MLTPIAILLVSRQSRLRELNGKLVLIVVIISGGVSLTSVGEIKYDPLGLVIQSLAIGVRSFFVLPFLVCSRRNSS